MATLRRDAARNRERILAAARELDARGEPLQLNAVARHAEVGVGTVYRHFATAESLSEALVEHRFGELIETAGATDDDPAAALRRFLRDALAANASDPAFAAATVNENPARPETALLRGELVATLKTLVAEASAHLRPGLTSDDLLILLCGLGYSARLRPDKAEAYLEALLDGALKAPEA